MRDIIAQKIADGKLIILVLLMILVGQLIPFLGMIDPTISSIASHLLGYIFYGYTAMIYILFAMLFAAEWKNLAEFHIDKFTILSFIISSLLRRRLGLPGEVFFVVVVAIAGIFVAITWARKKPSIPQTKINWVLVGILISSIVVVLAALVELAFRGTWILPDLTGKNLVVIAVSEIVREFSFGALPEEVLFRGFLLGYLIRKGLPEHRALWIQGIIFWLLHASRIFSPFTFFVLIPLFTVLYSKLTSYSKQVFPAVISHTLVNIVSVLLNMATI